MMAINWSIVLNVLLLFGLIIAIIRTLHNHKQQNKVVKTPSLNIDAASTYDEIIAVRKVMPAINVTDPLIQSTLQPLSSRNASSITPEISVSSSISDNITPRASSLEPKLIINSREKIVPKSSYSVNKTQPAVTEADIVDSIEPSQYVKTLSSIRPTVHSLMLFLRAKNNKQFVGYDLLQTLLAAGLRFGEGQLFHRHQHPNGQGTVMCSLAAATQTGTFDLQQMGAFATRGLCLFMHVSGNASIDIERFDIMLDTARFLAENLDAMLLDEAQKPLLEENIVNYHHKLHCARS